VLYKGKGVISVEERVTQHGLCKVIDGFLAQGIGGPFGDKDGNHVRNRIFKFSGKLK